MMTDRQKYFHLMGEVCEFLEPEAVDKAVRAGCKTPSNILIQVRLGRSPKLEALVDLVRYSHPEFEIPAHLLPVRMVPA